MGVSILDELAEIGVAVKATFDAERRVLSFEEYLELFAASPAAYGRDATQYVRDVFEHFGTTELTRPWGKFKRFNLFDLPWLTPELAQRDALVGQEQVQAELYRVVCNFVREGRPNKLPLLHGPNGSAKSTLARCIMLALEHYSQLAEGALYRFHWVFPSRSSVRGAIGFGDKSGRMVEGGTYAHLPDEQIDARVIDEVRDHPLMLLPLSERRALLEKLWTSNQVDARKNHWLWQGTLSHKNRRIFDALFNNYGGSLREVLRHVQVERYFISRRYRTGAVTIGPELSIDAGERQVTADRSIAALPSSLQAVALYDLHGELVDASGGLLEFSDLLKRPLNAFKYLQLTVETGEVALPSQMVRTNCVMLASANEVEVAEFRQNREFDSFRGRLEFIRTPYLRSYRDEMQIYDAQIAPHVRTHVVPHATEIAAMFAVLTRIRRPDPEKYQREVRDVIRSLTAIEKMDLYSTGDVPSRLDADKTKLLKRAIRGLYTEADPYAAYEGWLGASPREMRGVLLDAAQNSKYFGLSPFGVLDELDKLCARENDYQYLKEETGEGGFHDHVEFRSLLKERLLRSIEDEFRSASSLVDDERYAELFDRYIYHVGFWVKKEKTRNPITGEHEEPDEGLMREVEQLLGAPDDVESLRQNWLSRIAAWAIEHPGEPIKNGTIFEAQIRTIRDSVFADKRLALARLCRDVVVLGREDGSGLDLARTAAAERTIVAICEKFGYVRRSAVDSAAMLVKLRFSELLT